MSVTSGSVTGTSSNIGGLVGRFNNNNTNLSGLIEKSYANVTVQGSSSAVGGLLGGMNKTTIFRSYAKGNVSGTYYVGGLVGQNNYGKIEETYATGNVTATSSNAYAGGLVGELYSTTSNNQAIVTRSYATGNVNAGSGGYVGGLVGKVYQSNISDSYATGNVTTSGSYVGGLAGYTYGTSTRPSNISNVFATGNVSGGSSNVGGLVGYKPTYTYLTNAYRFSGQIIDADNVNTYGNVLSIFEVKGTGFYITLLGTTSWDISSISYPTLKNLPNQTSKSFPDVSITGAGTSSNPWKIYEAEDLYGLHPSYYSDYFILQKDIDLSGYSNWTPIGTELNRFTGNFNGNNKTISNLKINSSSSYRGLFGYIENANIRNLTLTNVNVTAGSYTGALAGRILNSTITNVSVTSGQVTGSASYVGGLIGHMTTSTVSMSSSRVTVTGYSYIGGLVGYNTRGEIIKSFATETVSGNGSASMCAPVV